jgi:signal transduction histidine kinase
MISSIILFAGIANLTMGVIVLFGAREKVGIRPFVFLCFSTFIWGICNFFVYKSSFPIFVRLCYSTSAVVMTALLVWAYTLSGYTGRKKRVCTILAYFVGISFALLPMLTDLIVYDIKKIGTGPFEEKYGPLFWLFASYFLITYGIVLILLLRNLKKSQKEEKKQAKLLFTGFSIYAGLSILFSFVLPIFDYNVLIDLDVPLSMIFIGFASYAIVSYRWMNIKLIAVEILSILIIGMSMMDIFLANSLDQRIGRSVLFLVTLVLMIFFVRSVMAEIKGKERLEKINKELKHNKKMLERANLELEKDKVITQRANEELIRLDKARTEFLNMASHQLRTPVSIIKGAASILIDGDLEESSFEEKKKFYGSILAKSEKLEAIIHDIMNATTLTSKKYCVIEKDAQMINIREFFEQIINDFELEVKTKNIEISLDIDTTAPEEIYGQRGYLKEVFINLINNAVKYTPSDEEARKLGLERDNKQGIIRIKVEKSGKDTVQIEINDNGIGINEDEQKKIFEKFYRAKNSFDVYTDGTGLGLFIVQEIVEGHGGKIWVKSQSGQGSTFFVELPINKKGEINTKKYIINSSK